MKPNVLDVEEVNPRLTLRISQNFRLISDDPTYTPATKIRRCATIGRHVDRKKYQND